MAKIDKILFVTLSNIGDVILTLPVLDSLRLAYPRAKITVVSGPRPAEIFRDNPNIEELVVYDKHAGLKEKIRILSDFYKAGFDLVVDLRNSIFGFLVPARLKTSAFSGIPADIKHMQARHLFKIENLKIPQPQADAGAYGFLHVSRPDQAYIAGLLDDNNIKNQDNIIVVSPGARSHIKRWPGERFAELCSRLIQEFNAKVVLVGDGQDTPINRYIRDNVKTPVIDLSAKTTISQLAVLLKKAKVLITNDSANMHLASYLNVPVVAVFGPTDDEKYRPWSDNSFVVKKELFCRPCRKAQCVSGDLLCMNLIRVKDVLNQVRDVLISAPSVFSPGQRKNFKRILICRTDRIGDVILSTPVITALRNAYPSAYIAMMVRPYTKDIVQGNPDLDEVIIYDKDPLEKSVFRFLKFANRIRKKKFDLALILHPANMIHLLALSAAIPVRVGYDRKAGFLLTQRVPHLKHLGQKHEMEYTLDMVRVIGIEPRDKALFVSVSPDSEKWVEELFREKGLTYQNKILALHPGSSCKSKMWPAERFAQAARELSRVKGFKVLILGSPQEKELAADVNKLLDGQAIDLSGTTISQDISILKRCALLITTDCGTMHMASALGVPQVVIFGRNQPGLSVSRWGPTGKNSRVLHKKVGCSECLAHDCKKDFACLKAVNVKDVLAAVESF
jgi:lipopolysaccharide heptosyltransferase II